MVGWTAEVEANAVGREHLRHLVADRGRGDVDADGYDDMLIGARLGYAEHDYPGAV